MENLQRRRSEVVGRFQELADPNAIAEFEWQFEGKTLQFALNIDPDLFLALGKADIGRGDS
jgi:hypothetical protein